MSLGSKPYCGRERFFGWSSATFRGLPSQTFFRTSSVTNGVGRPELGTSSRIGTWRSNALRFHTNEVGTSFSPIDGVHWGRDGGARLSFCRHLFRLRPRLRSPLRALVSRHYRLVDPHCGLHPRGALRPIPVIVHPTASPGSHPKLGYAGPPWVCGER